MSNLMFCPQCCHAGMRYAGIGDGYGDFGMQCCDVYICPNCGAEETDECVNCDENEVYDEIFMKGDMLNHGNE